MHRRAFLRAIAAFPALAPLANAQSQQGRASSVLERARASAKLTEPTIAPPKPATPPPADYTAKLRRLARMLDENALRITDVHPDGSTTRIR